MAREAFAPPPLFRRAKLAIYFKTGNLCGSIESNKKRGNYSESGM
jgi:hypothetical protein